MRSFVVLIATRDRAEALERCLSSVVEQELGPQDTLRVALVNNNTGGRALVLPERVRERARSRGVELTVTNLNGSGYALVRNAQLEQLRPTDDWAAFLDDDEQAPRSWLTGLAEATAAGQWDIVNGPVRHLVAESAPAWVHRAGLARVSGTPGGCYAATNNLLVSVAAWRACAVVFDRRFDALGSEDVDWTLRLGRAGLRIGFTPDVVVTEVLAPERWSRRYHLQRAYRSGAAATLIAGGPSCRTVLGGLARMLRALVLATVAALSRDPAQQFAQLSALSRGLGMCRMGLSRGRLP